MGIIRSCADGGIPLDLLISIVPPWSWGKGKAPGRFVQEKGWWTGNEIWQHGQSRVSLELADQFDPNCGLRLGREADGSSYIAIDGDIIDDPAGAGRDAKARFLSLIAREWGHKDLMFRQTVEPRFMLLVRIKSGGNVGRKIVINLTHRTADHPTGNVLGKIELLTKGQQAVIGGKHWSGNTIHWKQLCSTREYLMPLKNCLPEFDSMDHLADSVVRILKEMEEGGIFFEFKTKESRSDSGRKYTPDELAPPSYEVWCDLIRRMPNPEKADRDHYVTFWIAFQGCRLSLQALNSLTTEQDATAVGLALDWVERWESPPGKVPMDREQEYDKAVNDWLTEESPGIGWGVLVRLAEEFGVEGLRIEQSQREFQADMVAESERPLDERKSSEASSVKLEHKIDITSLEISPQMNLSPGNPVRSAIAFIAESYNQNGSRTLLYHRGTTYEWVGSHYRVLEDVILDKYLYAFLNAAPDFYPNRKSVDYVLDALQAEISIPARIAPPIWLGGKSFAPARELIACKNGLLHLPTINLLPHVPEFFNLNALNFDFDLFSPTPIEWLKFLNSLWPDDIESIRTLQEIFGLLLTGDTGFQKAFLMVGPPRSGKGTIAHVLTKLLGSENVVSPTLSSFGQNFGLSQLIDKRLATVTDARLGGRSDRQAIIERLLSITGEDLQTIDRKNKTHWTGHLPVRFLILTNELPALADASGALAGRFIILMLEKSFYGLEDRGLKDKLIPELAGILNWSIEGLQRLYARGYFIQPASSHDVAKELADLASPVNAFVQECCNVGPENEEDCSRLFRGWQQRCREQNFNAGNQATFGRNLRAAVPGIRIIRPREKEKSVGTEKSSGRLRRYGGIGLKSDFEFLPEPEPAGHK